MILMDEGVPCAIIIICQFESGYSCGGEDEESSCVILPTMA